MTPPPVPRHPAWQCVVRRWAILLGGGYLTVVVLMWLLENALVFHPVAAADGWEPAPVPDVRDVTCPSPNGIPVHGWWLPRAPDAPVLLICHGNAGNLSHRGRILRQAADDLKLSVLMFDYPGFGRTPGKPNEAACYDSAAAAVRWLRDDRGVSPERMIFFGESLGGGVATELATRYPCRALVLVKTFTSLPAAAKFHYPWLPVSWLMSNRFDNESKLGRLTCPVLVFGGVPDTVVPFVQSERLFAAANEPKAFVRGEETEHSDHLPDVFWTGLAAFLRRTAQ